MKAKKEFTLYDNGYLKLIGKKIIEYTDKVDSNDNLEQMSKKEKEIYGIEEDYYVLSRDYLLMVDHMIIDNHISSITCISVNDKRARFEYYKEGNRNPNYIDINMVELKVHTSSHASDMRYNSAHLTNEEFKSIENRVQEMVLNWLLINFRSGIDSDEYLENYFFVYDRFMNCFLSNIIQTQDQTFESISKFQNGTVSISKKKSKKAFRVKCKFKKS